MGVRIFMKTTKRLSLLQCLLPLPVGIVLGLHRGLGAPGGAALAIVGAAAAVILLGCSMEALRFTKKHGLAPAKPDKLSFALLAAGGVLFLLAGGLFLLFPTGSSQAIRMVTAAFSFLCGVCTFARLRDRDGGSAAAQLSLAPVFFQSFYLLVFYRANGDNPYLGQFGYEIAVFALVLLGLYCTVCGRYEDDRPLFRTWSLSAALAGIVQELLFFGIHGQSPLTLKDFGLGTLALLAAQGCLMVNALFFPPEKLSPPPEKADPEEEDPEAEDPEAEEPENSPSQD